MIANTLSPAQALLAVLGFAALIGVLFLVVKVVSLKMGGWKEIAERFPMRDVNFTGDSFRKQEGNVGNIGSSGRGLFDICLATKGVCIYPFFARRNPCLVPWSSVRRVSVSDTSLLLVVDYERLLSFSCPSRCSRHFRPDFLQSCFIKRFPLSRLRKRRSKMERNRDG